MPLNSLSLIIPKRHGDNRGFFAEIYNRKAYFDQGIDFDFVQDNHSLSLEKGTIRGLHFQAPPHAQAKLVRCGRGAIFDVAVDIRQNSPNFGKWEGYNLTAENGHQLYIPIGFAHGFATLTAESEIIYKCSDFYSPETEATILWSDSDIGINWPVDNAPILSPKDTFAPCLKNIDSPFIYVENS
jgi:dTDP-4-dehydrorhamnose 3,5-epimerase